VALLETRENGIYCPGGDFYIDPWAEVDKAVITHAHADHAHPGARAYLAAAPGVPLLRARLETEAPIQPLAYGEEIRMGSVKMSLHPAGHILGSAQVRLERGGEVWVFSGDYKLAPDPTCEPFEPLRCNTFVTESTFALPVFRWPAESEVIDAIHTWWRANRESGKASLLFAHSLGKAQRLLALLDPAAGPIVLHDSIERINRYYREQGIPIPVFNGANGAPPLVLAPPSCHGTPWAKRFGPASTALVSGWMRIRGTRRRRALDRGFVLSDHADWPALLRAIDATGAENVWVGHGHRAPLARWLTEHGRNAVVIDTRFGEAAS
jgi:putative mRNA 3-end processing factor